MFHDDGLYKGREEAFKRILEERGLEWKPEEFDSVDIEGVPPIHQKISPCVHGDHGTIAMNTNMIPQVINAEPGLKTMVDLPVVYATSAHFSRYLKR